MKILVTGGAGFIGSSFVRLAIKKGFEILNIDAMTYSANINNLNSISDSKSYEFRKANILEAELVSKILYETKPDAIIHLAAETHVDRSINNPELFLKTNVLGTYNMLEASLDYWMNMGKPKDFRFHHVSTDEVFGSLSLGDNSKFNEQTAYDPRSPYAASKASSDHLVRAWFETYDLPILISNCSNNYGPCQFPEKLIPLMILNAVCGKTLPIYGDGLNVRDWIYVEDHAEALFAILKYGKIGEAYNVGANTEKSNIEIVSMLCDILDKFRPKKNGKYRELIKFVSDRPGHDTRYAIDNSKIVTELDWKPSMDLANGLKKTVKWYLENRSWWEPLYHKVTSKINEAGASS